MDGTYCATCGAKLDEAPTLFPEPAASCPTCGSLTRFDQAGRSVSVTVRSVADAILQAPIARASGSALDSTVCTDRESVTDPSGPRHITDRLVVMGRCLEWTAG
jgi:hypothetical protein